MPLEGDAKPRPKSAQLARGQRRYRRKVASPKQWQAIISEKQGPCRVHVKPSSNGLDYGKNHMHHVVARDHFGDDVPDNIVPVCAWCHARLHAREVSAAIDLLGSLSDAEYAYMMSRGGKDYPERAYGVRYERP